MAALSEKFGDDLAILAFPSGEFGNQELPTDEKIKAKVLDSFAFPPPPRGYLMSKGLVNGDDAREAWKLMKEATGAADPDWNFSGKFIVAKDGTVSVPGDDLEADIQALL